MKNQDYMYINYFSCLKSSFVSSRERQQVYWSSKSQNKRKPRRDALGCGHGAFIRCDTLGNSWQWKFVASVMHRESAAHLWGGAEHRATRPEITPNLFQTHKFAKFLTIQVSCHPFMANEWVYLGAYGDLMGKNWNPTSLPFLSKTLHRVYKLYFLLLIPLLSIFYSLTPPFPHSFTSFSPSIYILIYPFHIPHIPKQLILNP